MYEYMNTRDIILYAVGGVAFLVLLVWWLWRRRQEPAPAQRASAEQEKQAEQNAALALARKGTHNANGQRLCLTCPDKVTVATQPPFVLQEDTGWRDLVRRSFGAPARYTFDVAKDAEPVYCDQCHELMKLAHAKKLLTLESRLREQHMTAGIELRRWFKFGCNDAVAHAIEEHDNRVEASEPKARKAPVLSMRTEANEP